MSASFLLAWILAAVGQATDAFSSFYAISNSYKIRSFIRPTDLELNALPRWFMERGQPLLLLVAAQASLLLAFFLFTTIKDAPMAAAWVLAGFELAVGFYSLTRALAYHDWIERADLLDSLNVPFITVNKRLYELNKK